MWHIFAHMCAGAIIALFGVTLGAAIVKVEKKDD